MKYIGEFTAIDRRSYRVEIETEQGEGEQRLTLSGTPFVSSVSSDGKNLYAPVRCGGATVGILTDSYIPGLYSAQAKGTKVSLYLTSYPGQFRPGESLEWTGYAVPTMYDQGYGKGLQELQLDCVDGIAVLKDIPFRAERRRMETFAEIIRMCLAEAGCFDRFYISDNVQLARGGGEAVCSRMRVSTSNFFDDRKDPQQTDDDLAWSCYDVISALAQFLGYTAVCHGSAVYFADYDAIAAGSNGYFQYSMEPGATPTHSLFNAASLNHIAAGSYAGSGTRLSLDKVCNKVTVKDSFHSYDSVFPDFGDIAYETNVTKPVADLSPLFIPLYAQGGLWFGDHVAADPSLGIREPFVAALDSDIAGNVRINFFRFYESPVFSFNRWLRNAAHTPDDRTENLGGLAYSDMLLRCNGAFYTRWAMFDIDRGEFWKDPASWVLEQRKAVGGYEHTMSADSKLKRWAQLFSQISNMGKIQLQPMIVLVNWGDYRFGPGDGTNFNARTEYDETKKYPYITLKQTDSAAVFGGRNHFLRIRGKVRYHDRVSLPHPLVEDEKNIVDSYDDNRNVRGDRKDGDQFYLWCKVRWGSNWWNGEDWQQTDCWFKLYFYKPGIYGEHKQGWMNTEHFNKDFPFISNDLGMQFLGEDGYIIPCPTSGNLSGQAEVSLTTRDMHGDSKNGDWSPKGTKFDNFYMRTSSSVVMITDFKVTAEVASGLFSDEEFNSDTSYTNVIDNGSVEKLADVEFKVCTDDGKKPSYSSVDYLSGGESVFVRTTCNLALAMAEGTTAGADGEFGMMRQEEHMVFKLASQYSEPRLVLSADIKPWATLSGNSRRLFGSYTFGMFPGRKFILTDIRTDYRAAVSSVKLTEKAQL